MTARRVFVTGVGIVSPLGVSADEHFRRLLLGESAVTRSAALEYRNFPSRLEARIGGFDRRRLLTDRMLRKVLSDAAAYPVAAAGQAIHDTGLADRPEVWEDCGLYVGSIAVEANPEVFIPAFKESLDERGEFDMSRFATRGMKLLDPLFLVKALPNAGLCGISIQYQVLGPNLNVTNGAVSGGQAIAAATAAIRRAETDLALAGGYDSLLRMDTIVEQTIEGRLSTRLGEPEHACRPFDQERDGYALGEGAAFVVLEAEAHARARESRVYGEVFSTAQTTDASHVAQPDLTGPAALVQAARVALQRAGCTPADLGVIFGDGLATLVDDRREAAALKSLVGDAPIPFTAATGALGFSGAASGAFSFVSATMALHREVVPPLINCHRPDPECLVHRVDAPHERRYARALVWSSERGIKNIAFVVGLPR